MSIPTPKTLGSIFKLPLPALGEMNAQDNGIIINRFTFNFNTINRKTVQEAFRYAVGVAAIQSQTRTIPSAVSVPANIVVGTNNNNPLVGTSGIISNSLTFNFNTFNGKTFQEAFRYAVGVAAIQSQRRTIPSAVSIPANIVVGTNNDDILVGTNNFDRIIGQGGNDTIFALGGNDQISGGNGNDTIDGGNGNDLIFGGDGNDSIFGGNGYDVIVGVNPVSGFGAAEQDVLTGGAGGDVFVLGDLTHVYYDDGNSASIGESDYAVITDLKVGQDFIQLYGSANLYSLDFYTTDSGIKADLIYDSGVAARGEIIGILENVAPTLKVTDFFLPEQKLADPSFIGSGDYAALYNGIFGSYGVNTLLAPNWDPIFRVNPRNDSPPNVINGTDGDDILIGTDVPPGLETFGNSFNYIPFAPTPIFLTSYPVPASLNDLGNNAGNITILSVSGSSEENITPSSEENITPTPTPPPLVSSGNDIIHGFGGNDIISGLSGNDTLFGDAGNDTIDGGSGNDFIDGGIGNDSLTGGDGDDTIFGGGGDNTIDGGSGNDTINVTDGDGNNNILGGEGNDTINAGSGNDIIDGGNGNNTINAGDGDNNILGGEGNDTINAGSGNDTINAGSGNNTINAGDGDNNILSGEGNDTINAGSGNDTINAGSGNNTINAGDGDNNILSGEGNDTINAGSGNDTINGGGGNDIINAGDGNNNIFGGEGNDTLTGGSGNDTINGGGGNDIINAGDGDNSIFGGEGYDTINAGSGNDTIKGGSGSDTINAGKGNDILIGVNQLSGFGAFEQDTLTGGLGKDKFVLGDANRVYYSDGNSVTTGESDYALITDFNAVEDTIQLNGAAKFYNLDFYTTSLGIINAALTYDPGVTERRELIGIIQEVSPTLTLNNSAFVFV